MSGMNGVFAKRRARLLAMKAIRDNHIPGDKAITCPKCGQDSDRKSVAQNLSVCPKCGYHFPIGAYYRLSTILDPGSFRELFEKLPAADPLSFPGYRAKLPEETIRAGNGTASNELPDGNLPYWFYMDLRTGEVRALDSGCLYGLLEEYPDLYENYMTEPEPNRKETLDGYFDAYLGRAGGRP